MKDYRSSVWVNELFDIHAESQLLEDLRSRGGHIRYGICADHLTGRAICHTENKFASAFVGDRNGVFANLWRCKRLLRLFEFEVLILPRGRKPSIEFPPGLFSSRLSEEY